MEKIIIVEKRAVIAEEILKVVKIGNYKVEVVKTNADAFLYYDSGQTKAIVLENNYDGLYRILRRIRLEDRKTVIFVKGHPMADEEIEMALGEGADNYITHFTVLYLQHIDAKRNFSIQRTDIPMNNFLTEVERLSRTVTAEVYFDKKLLGSDALNFSNRTVSLKRDLVLTAKASTKESITEVGIDLWNKMQHKDSPISRVRIKGIDENDNAVLLDTSFFCRQEFVTVELNAETGEVNSTQLLSRLQNLAKDF